MNCDALVIGGGFYGTSIAIYLAKHHQFDVIMAERESVLLSRASCRNQARVHNGYHYPRSFTTAFRSRLNFQKFIHTWPNAIKKDFAKVYAIARRNSKVTTKQFVRFCNDIGARIQPANADLRKLFDSRLIEDLFLVEEYAFDSNALARDLERECRDLGVRIILNTEVARLSKVSAAAIAVETKNAERGTETILCRNVFNCSYSGLNQLKGDFPGVTTSLKHELTEMVLLNVPAPLKDLGVTVMDGPFFSVMPFPSRNLHTLSHVRYTPHFNWVDHANIDPYKRLSDHKRGSRFERMIRDAARYLPVVRDAEFVESLFEIKTVLVKNEGDDGRPILFEKYDQFPGVYSILGGKIDNIYDVLEKLELELSRIN